MQSRLSLSSSFLFPLLFLSLTQIASAGSATWKSSPSDNTWNKVRNWTPATVPNSPSDVATFDASSVTNLLVSADTEINALIFTPAASAYTIGQTAFEDTSLTISGTGVTNNSSVTQHFTTRITTGEIDFKGSATAGTNTVFTNEASGGYSTFGGTNFFDTASAGSATFVNNNTTTVQDAGRTYFYDSSTAGTGTFINNGSIIWPSYGGTTVFRVNSTAGHGTFYNYPGSGQDGGSTGFIETANAGNGVIINYGSTETKHLSGRTFFVDSSTAGNATITNEPSEPDASFGGVVNFYDSASGGNATIINNGGNVSGSSGGYVSFVFGGDAGNATIINNGATAEGGGGASTYFSVDSSAGNSTLIANGGAGDFGYGAITFDQNSSGGNARVEVFGNGKLWFPYLGDFTIGSIEGDGVVELVNSALTVGSNDLDTTFSGSLSGAGPLTKVGKATLTLSGRNRVRNGLIITEGTVAVNGQKGSGTGPGPVKVEHGTLTGKGIIQGTVTVGGTSGRPAALSPGKRATHPNTLTIQSLLTFASNSTYVCGLYSDTSASDKVVAAGVTIDPASSISLNDLGSSIVTSGTVFTIISNIAPTPITGTFSNLPDGGTVVIGSNTFRANYEGGDGNDLTLTVVP